MKWYWWILLAIMVGYAASAQACECEPEIEPPTDACITYCTGDIDPADPLEDEVQYIYTEEDMNE